MNNLNQNLQRAIKELGFKELTPIQEQAIPVALEGYDILGHSQTGTGKTAAFSLPILEYIEANQDVQALIITPTRELAVQIKEAMDKFSKYLPNIKSVAIFGGEAISKQIKALKKRPQIIIATPGRLMDHMNRKLIRLDALKWVVLDEADEMLKMGFKEDIELILNQAPTKRQTFMFSATMPKPMQRLASTYLTNPKTISVVSEDLTSEHITQNLYYVSEKNKLEALNRILSVDQPNKTLIFCNTKHKVDSLTLALSKLGYLVGKIHGDLPQTKRIDTLNDFHRNKIDMLVATDVAARGLDIKMVDAVFNYDVPEKSDFYIHRIGRTGRAKEKGISHTFVTKKDMHIIKEIKVLSKAIITDKQIPSYQESAYSKIKDVIDTVDQTIKKENHHNYKKMAKELITYYNAENIVAALLAQYDLAETQHDVNESFTSKKEKFNQNDKSLITFEINLGTKMGLTPKTLVMYMEKQTALRSRDIKNIRIKNQKAYFSVTDKNQYKVKSLHEKKYQGKTVYLASVI
ncbi:MAG: DEAD/DEAH box helicase [Candidatus Izemoplasmataceae bacterium]